MCAQIPSTDKIPGLSSGMRLSHKDQLWVGAAFQDGQQQSAVVQLRMDVQTFTADVKDIV